MPASEARRKLREKPCTCQYHYSGGPHDEGCPRRRDTSKAKAIRAVLVEKRYPENEGEWLSLAEFHYIDLFSFRCWTEWPDSKLRARTGLGPRIHRRVAHEIKVSRSDFRAELRKPRKRAFAMNLCHQFFFVTPPGLVRKDEIPEGCGLLIVDADAKTVALGKRAPIRLPSASLRTEDVADLLRARHIGRDSYAVRREMVRWKGLYESAERRVNEAEKLADRARAQMIQERGHLLVAGSEWLGPWPWRPFPSNKTVRENVRVKIARVSVDERYDDMTRERILRAHMGTVYIDAADGDGHSGTWVDPGDFLISYRPVEQERRVVPDSRVRRPGERSFEVVPGGVDD